MAQPVGQRQAKQVGGNFCRGAVQRAHQPRCADAQVQRAVPQGAAHNILAAAGQRIMAEAVPAFFRNANELGILDPVGAYRSNMDACRGKLVMQRLGVAEQERLGGGVYVQPRNGLEPRSGANLQYLTAWCR